ncbi:MAG TPA: PBP1A family penicillin-binding protein [Syntrophales bacterium]|nr:PBP1A family penicillin-binding protein [Syntrophales bacterium]HOM06218.1 PBP1A family penicillin-binding protein [Syntrophales bacterium]HON99342.1 PBP1A family penicillin-binding protein [Syntrophales bacterium]HPQ05800.1 PBP1A family penicillin-binding protein [Syntrophales bacterium]HRV41884.1 PBP1A family penicillin-binding protein [Syntrophales bacterium]
MKHHSRNRGFATIVIIAAVAVVSLILIGAALLVYLLVVDLPSVATLKDYRPSIATRVYADNNELVDEFFLEDRKIIRVADLPKFVIHAFVAAEDSRFFEHRGIDPQSISRAFLKNLGAGRIVQGGSTITQQVAKSLFLTPERSYTRKLKEAILAYKIDHYLTKEEILNLYLNQIYLGHGTYGIEAAAQGYFGKSARQLTLPEAAMLAGLPKAPSTYSPFTNPERARQRQAYVLERMYEDGYITQQERERALNTPLVLRSVRPKEKIAPYFVEEVRRYILSRYGSDVLYKEGLEVYTTLNISMQKAARDAVERGLRELEDRQKYERGLVQGALLAMDARTGAIKAMVGGRDFTKSEFNRATQSRRQPGSAFKPFIYTAAFDKGLTPVTTVMDEPIEFPDPSSPDGMWRPKNFDGKYNGPTTLRTAIVQSRNVVTVKVLREIGVDYAAAYAANMGITSPLTKNLSLALGSSGVTLLEMVRAYGVLANQGRRVTPFFITRIVDRTGHIFEENQVKVEQVIDPRIAFISTYIMQDVVESGTGRRVRGIGRPVAGKTGTTNDVRDAWFIGFTPSLVAGVWVGFDQERPLGHQEVGGRAAAPIWLYFMEKALAGTPVETFPVPEGIVFARVGARGDPEGGARGYIYECFLEGTVPENLTPISPRDVGPARREEEEE